MLHFLVWLEMWSSDNDDDDDDEGEEDVCLKRNKEHEIKSNHASIL